MQDGCTVPIFSPFLKVMRKLTQIKEQHWQALRIMSN